MSSKDYEEHESVDTWITIRLGDAFLPGDLFDGPFGSNLKTSDYTDQGVRVIRLENIGLLNFMDDKKTFISTDKYRSLKKHEVKAGDLIVASFVSDDVKAVVLPDLKTTAVAKADCFTLRPIDSLLNTKHLAFLLSSPQIHKALSTSAHGATRPRINIGQLKELRIPLPPLEEQREVVHRLEALFKAIDQMETRYESARVRVDKLTQSILSKAFRGELVPTEAELARREGRDYEPASVLLERIKAERKAEEAKKSSQRRPAAPKRLRKPDTRTD